VNGGEKAPLRVVCGIIWRAGKVLAAQRGAGKAHAGWWEFPGGKIEAGESGEEALVRELGEELGITVHGPVFLTRVSHAYASGPVDLSFFEVRRFDGEPIPAEGQGLRWVTPAEGLNLPFLPPDLPILKGLAETARQEETSCIS